MLTGDATKDETASRHRGYPSLQRRVSYQTAAVAVKHSS